MSFRQNTEEYYQKFIELQEQLRKSEEERLKLEMKFNEMMQITREEEQAYYRKLRTQYKQFLEENRKRQDRNERILRMLERVESRAAILEAKTQRFQLLRKQYQSYLNRIYARKENFKPIEKVSTMHPVEKRENILESYLRSMESQDRSRSKFTLPSENASTIADEIMQSIYSRGQNNKGDGLPYFKRDDYLSDNLPTTTRFPAGYNQIGSKDNIGDGNHHAYFENDGIYQHQGQNSLQKDVKNLSNGYLKDERGFKEDFRRDYRRYDGEQTPSTSTSISNLNEATETKGVRWNEPLDNHPLHSPDKTENKPLSGSKEYLEPSIKSPTNSEFLSQNQKVNFSKDKTVVEDPELISQKIEEVTDAYPKESNIVQEIQNEVDIPRPLLNGSHVENLQVTVKENDLNDDVKNVNEKAPVNLINSSEINQNIQETDTEFISKEQLKQNGEYSENIISSNPEETMQNYPRCNEDQIHNNGKVLTEQKSDFDESNGQYEDYNQSEQINDKNHETVNSQFDDKLTNQDNTHGKNEESATYDQNDQQSVIYDQQNVESNQPIGYDENGQPVYNNNTNYEQYDENGQHLQYDENGQPIYTQYDQTGQQQFESENIQYDENGQPVQYDENGQPVQYNENGEVITTQYDESGAVQNQNNHYDENGQPIQYDENGQPIQYNENGQPIQYDENGQPIQYNENSQPIQYDENGQPIQYDENGQPIQYDENGQPLQYDENGQLIQYQYNQDQNIHYDENGQPINYDENGFPVTYDENGEIISNENIQYDENGQPIYSEITQFDENGYSIVDPNANYDENGQIINYAPNDVDYDENGQPVYTNEENEQNTALEENSNVQESSEITFEENKDEANEKKKPNVLDLLESDSESAKQDTNKVSNDSDFDFSNK